jgi:hypothetical protein
MILVWNSERTLGTQRRNSSGKKNVIILELGGICVFIIKRKAKVVLYRL